MVVCNWMGNISMPKYYSSVSVSFMFSSINLFKRCATLIVVVVAVSIHISISIHEISIVGAKSATADSCFVVIGPRQCSVALGGPAVSTEDLRHQGAQISQEF